MSSPDPESDLVARAIAGDRRALDDLLAAHLARIHAICRRVVANPQDALDATQNACIAIAGSITRFDGRARFSTWTHRIAVNAALDEIRRSKRRPVPVDALPERSGTSPHDRVETRLEIDAAMSELPEEYRVAITLRDLIGLDYAEIASVLDVPIGTVRSRIARGRAALADRLREPIDGVEASKEHDG